jgi:hypothetical protein
MRRSTPKRRKLFLVWQLADSRHRRFNETVQPTAHESMYLAQELLRHAIVFRDAAVRLSDRKPFLFQPTFYCVLHSIELALKAHLAHAGFRQRELASRGLGHDLDALLQAATKEGCLDRSNLDAFDRKAISWGGKDYSKKCFEYPESMVSTHPIGRWLLIGRKLIKNAALLIGPQRFKDSSRDRFGSRRSVRRSRA